MSVPSEEKRFQDTVLDLAGLIKELVTTAQNKGFPIVNPALVGLGENILQAWEPRSLIDNFIQHSAVHWSQIKRREEKFFDDHAAQIFKDLPIGDVNAFKKLFLLKDKEGNPVIDPNDKTVIWDFFHSLVKISIHYIHRHRRPGNVDRKACYWATFHPHVDMEATIVEWQADMKEKPSFNNPRKDERGNPMSPAPVYGEIQTQPIFLSRSTTSATKS